MSSLSQSSSKPAFTVRKLALTGMLGALVFAASLIQIPLPAVVGVTRLHLGNALCLLAGMLVGPVAGGLAAGIGSSLFDVLNPAYITSAPFTFVFKFLMAFVCGTIVRRGTGRQNSVRHLWLGSTAGAVLYVLLYLSKNFISDLFFKRMELIPSLLDIAGKAGASLFNAGVGVLGSVLLCLAVKNGLKRSHYEL